MKTRTFSFMNSYKFADFAFTICVWARNWALFAGRFILGAKLGSFCEKLGANSSRLSGNTGSELCLHCQTAGLRHCVSPRVKDSFIGNMNGTGSISSRSVKVLDGGLGTELERAEGCDLLEHPLWSARLLKDNPNAVKEAHKRFFLAGSNAVITASYQASVNGLVEHCDVSKEEARSLIQLSVDLAKDAVAEVKSISSDKEKEYFVAGSVAPYGAILHDMSEYTGNYVDNMTIEELKDWHRERLSLLLSREPDFIAIETMPALKEVSAVLELLKEYPNAKAWVTFSCKDTKSTFHGDNFAEAVKTVSQHPQVTSVGVNCTHPDNVMGLLEGAKYSLAPGKTFIVYPNSRLEFQGNSWVKEKTSRNLAEYVPEWLTLGVLEWVGGCCCSTPEDITKISNAVKDSNLKE